MTAPSTIKSKSEEREPAEPVRVLVAGTSPLLTSVWSATLASAPGFHVVGSSTTLEETLPLVPHSDVLAFCPGTQLESGVEWVRMLTQTFPESRILAVGLPHQDHIILAFIEAGACAYVPQDETVDSVLQSLAGLVRGEAFVAPEVAPALIARLARLRQAHIDPDTVGTRLEPLTPREREILELVANQLTNRDISHRLSIEVGTVKNHVHSILEKMSLESRYQAAAYVEAAHRSELVESTESLAGSAGSGGAEAAPVRVWEIQGE
jgi:two-component system, NarL family, nitrate/nitrite response regulator NarL